MLARGHAPDVCEGNVDMVASFPSRMLNFCQDSRRVLAQFHLAELRPFSGRTKQLARRQRHTRRLMPLATPSSEVGDATCA